MRIALFNDCIIALQSMLTHELPLSFCVCLSPLRRGAVILVSSTTAYIPHVVSACSVCPGWERVWWFPKPGADPLLLLLSWAELAPMWLLGHSHRLLFSDQADECV